MSILVYSFSILAFLSNLVFANSLDLLSDDNFVEIPSGTFMMGSPETETHRLDDEILHQVTISKDFEMQKTEVTQAQWKNIMGYNPSYFRGDNHPVESIGWYEIKQFIQWLNIQKIDDGYIYRLPTEAEWEYSARATTETAFYFGNDLIDPHYKKYGYVIGNSENTTHPVATKIPNLFGVYDTFGNVSEWVEDCYGLYPTAPVTDPVNYCSSDPKRRYNIIRGGDFQSFAIQSRAAYRATPIPARPKFVGFRLVRIKE
jgi:formylglycine-generating enzyme required for sulfatase activity